MTETSLDSADKADHFPWYVKGVRAAFSIPGLVLIMSFVGFAALARETGFSLAETIFMIIVIWALPAKVVLIGGVVSGAGLFAVTLAVALSSVRLMPMTVTMIPEMRGPKTRTWVLYLLSHFIAVTSWVIAMERFPNVPKATRTSFYFGIGSTLMTLNILMTTVIYISAASMSDGVAAAFFMLTPMYFLTSLWSSAREWAGHLSIVLGLVFGPLYHLYLPQIDLLAAGVSAGVIAYVAHRLSARRGEI